MGEPGSWPAGAIPARSQVKVVRDEQWDGPWANEFFGIVDPSVTPQLVVHAHAAPGELVYLVKFGEPQFDSTGDGPYSKAMVWGRYLRPMEPVNHGT